MKVSELIKKLELLNQDSEVILTSSNFELNGSKVPVSSVIECDSGSKETRSFRDAFDGEIYNKEVWNIVGGKELVVYLS